jgi:hypothetical protein
MSEKYKLFAIKALGKNTKGKMVTESRMTYEDGHNERMSPELANQLRDKSHSLGKHPAFPDDDESNFEEKLMSKRFKDVVKAFKRHHGTENIDPLEILQTQGQLMLQVITLEAKHQDRLVELAIQLVRDEFDVDENDVVIEARFTTDMSLNVHIDKLKIKPTSDIEFDNHEEFSQANKEVYKRRMINALIQGSAKKTNHMFHMIDEELQELEPLLPSSYSKLMTGADYMYMVNDDTKPRMIGGIVNVEFPKSEGDIPKIIVEAMTLPVLIHEIVKGVMEILSYHGLPKDPKMAQFVIDKADFMAAESWDMRLGPPIWEKFAEAIPSEDFALKHHVYVELVALPVDEFNSVLREILMGTRSGKAKIEGILEQVKDELKNDEFDNAMDKLNDDDYLGPEDLDNFTGEDWFM